MEIKTQEAHSTHFEHLSEMKDAIGKELGLSNWFEIKQEDINTFGRITGDEQWIHIDVERSKRESPYKNTIAHGFMVLSLASKFAYETYSVGDVVMGVNYGLNKVRFPNATLSGSMVRGRVSLKEFEPITGGGKYVMNLVFEIKGQEKPACVAEFVAIAYTKPNA